MKPANEVVHSKVVEVDLYGKVGCAEHERFVPEIRRIIHKHGTVRILVTMHNFSGWNIGVLWDELKLNAKAITQIERLAMVGENTLQKWMTAFCESFTTGKVRFFTLEQLEGAREWLKE